MKFAHFSHIWAKPGMTPHQRYEELWRELQLCDELGFDYGFCVEHHFRPGRELDVFAQPLCGRRRRAHAPHAPRPDGLYRAALSSAAAGRRDRHCRSDARRPHGARARARHQSRIFPPLRSRLRSAQVADARIRRLHARGLRRDAAVLVPRQRIPHRQRPAVGAAGAAPASAAVDDEPRSADAGILRAKGASIPAISWSIPAPMPRRATAHFWTDWNKAGWPRKPNIAYCTIVYVDETDDKAMEIALSRASRAYEGFLRARQAGGDVRTNASRPMPRDSSAAASRARRKSWRTFSTRTT